MEMTEINVVQQGLLLFALSLATHNLHRLGEEGGRGGE